MIEAIVHEIALTPFYDDVSNQINTVYFGGGTPSLLTTDELQLLLDALHKKFKISPDAEITLEANPDDISAPKLRQWLGVGINRLSVGVQSFLQEELDWMNRAHSASDATTSIDEIQKAGFTDFSLDLIFGSPLLTNEEWKRNVAFVIEKNIPHISCYALTVEPSTALHKMIAQHKKQPVDAEKQAAQFLLLMQWMEEAGYEHYEISNFAKPGMRSKHNSSYWQAKHYYGFGPSAHSYDGWKRKWNVANNALYIQSLKDNLIPFDYELLSTTQQLNEYLMTSIRTMEGIDLEKVKEEFGVQYSDALMKASNKWILDQKINASENKLVLTREGKLFADGIAADLFF